jgi:ABC-type nitrate/sulfonate/bicarbonate transport system substrate-binding protein
MNRKRLWGVAAGALAAGSLLAACSSGSSSSTGSTTGTATTTSPVTLQLNWITDATWAGSYMAQADGYYKAEGLDVDLATGGPNVDYMAQLSAGHALIAFAGFNDPATLNAKGGNFRVIGTMYQRSPIGIISKAGSGITDPASLEGKRLGLETSSLLNWEQFAKVNHIDTAKVKIVNIQDGPTALASGQVDAYMGYSTEAPSLLAAKGIKSQYFLLQSFGFGYYVDVYAVRETDLENPAKRALIEKLLKADLEGQLAAIEHPTAAGQLTTKLYGKSLGLSLATQVSNATEAVPFYCSATAEAEGIGYMGGTEMTVAVDTINLINGTHIPTSGAGLVDMSVLNDIKKQEPSFGKIPASVCKAG